MKMSLLSSRRRRHLRWSCWFLNQLFSIMLLLLPNDINAIPPDKTLARHTAPPRERTGSFSYPRYSKESELMLSPCRPEKDGYFGGTYGKPAILQYGFNMELKPEFLTLDGDDDDDDGLDGALTTIENHVIDRVISETFPSLCAFDDHPRRRRRRLSRRTETETVTGTKGDGRDNAQLNPQRGHRQRQQQQQNKKQDGWPTGFYFHKDLKADTTKTCMPSIDEANLCVVYSGKISIFGHSIDNSAAIVHVVHEIRQALSDARNLTMYGNSTVIVQISSSDKVTRIVSSQGDPSKEEQKRWRQSIEELTPMTKAIISFCATAVLLGSIMICLSMRIDRSRIPTRDDVVVSGQLDDNNNLFKKNPYEHQHQHQQNHQQQQRLQQQQQQRDIAAGDAEELVPASLQRTLRPSKNTNIRQDLASILQNYFFDTSNMRNYRDGGDNDYDGDEDTNSIITFSEGESSIEHDWLASSLSYYTENNSSRSKADISCCSSDKDYLPSAEGSSSGEPSNREDDSGCSIACEDEESLSDISSQTRSIYSYKSSCSSGVDPPGSLGDPASDDDNSKNEDGDEDENDGYDENGGSDGDRKHLLLDPKGNNDQC